MSASNVCRRNARGIADLVEVRGLPGRRAQDVDETERSRGRNGRAHGDTGSHRAAPAHAAASPSETGTPCPAAGQALPSASTPRESGAEGWRDEHQRRHGSQEGPAGPRALDSTVVAQETRQRHEHRSEEGMGQVRHLEHRGPAYLQRDGRRQRVQKACCVDRGPRAASCDEAHDRAHGRDDGQASRGRSRSGSRMHGAEPSSGPWPWHPRGESHLSREEEEGPPRTTFNAPNAARASAARSARRRRARQRATAAAARRPPRAPTVRPPRAGQTGASVATMKLVLTAIANRAPARRALRSEESLRQVDECQRGHQVRDGGLVVV